MNAATTTTGQSDVTSREIEQIDRAIIDASARTPVLFLYTTALMWLLVATVLGFISSIKLHHPDFFGDWSWMTYGRVRPAYIDCLAYGWGIPAGLGTAIWLMARLCRVSLRAPMMLVFGTAFWHIGVAAGLVGILSGNSTGFDLLEFPRFAAAIMFVGYSLMAVWGVVMFRLRRPGHIYISLWYILGAFFWFPWFFAAAYLMHGTMSTGVMGAVVTAWYGQNLMSLWFAMVGLGAVYYLIPKVIGRPVHSYSLASLGFWSLAFVSGWTGMTHHTGGPLPAWLITVSIVATILMIIPIATVTLNYALTMRGSYHMVHNSPTVRFVVFGAIAWSVAGLLAVITSMRSVDRITHFTHVSSANTHLMLYAFYSMVIFGSMYYIIPRLVGCEWLSASFIQIHFWGSAYGIGLAVVMLFIGGVNQGLAWNNPQLSPVDVVQTQTPYLIGASVAWILLASAHFIFLLHFLAMLLRLGQPGGQPTLFATDEEE